MKRLLPRIIVCGFLIANLATAQLVVYNPDSPALSGITASFAATSTNANVVVTDITRGSGLTGTSASGGFSSSSWSEGSSFATAISNNNYYTFTISPAANYSLSFTSITANVLSSSTGATTAQWGNGSTALGSSVNPIVTTGSTGTTISASLSDTGVTSATEFRLVAWSASSSAGTTKIEQSASLSGSATLRSAGTLTWDGGQGNGNWNSYTASAADQSNWNSNNIPTTALVDNLIFAGSTQTTTTNNISGLTVGAITFNSGASSFTLAGNSITLNSGVTNNSSNSHTISFDLALSSGSHAIDATSGNLSFSGALSGSGSVTKSGANTVTLSGNNTYSGGTTVNAGTLTASHANALGTGTATINSGGTLNFNGVTIGNNISLSSGTLTAASSGNGTTGTVSGSGSLGSSLSLGAYNWSLTNGSTASQLTLAGSSTLSLSLLNLSFASGWNPSEGQSIWNSNQSWTVVDGSSGSSITGTALGTNGTGWSLGSFALSNSGNDLTLNWTATAIPEPSAYAALFGVVALTGVLIRRRRLQRTA